METTNTTKAKAIKDKHLSHLTNSLSSLRIPEKSDVILTCRGKEFPVHKVILEASSPYFETMFRSGLEEAKLGKVMFEILQPETLEAILDFIYLGDVHGIHGLKILEILKASHMMQLENLFSYCCDIFLSSLSIENMCIVWLVGTMYERDKIVEPVLEFMFSNRVAVLSSNAFLSIAAEHMKQFLQFSVTKQVCMDDLLRGLMKWLCANFKERKHLANELLGCIGVEFVTQQCIYDLLNDENLMKSSDDIANNLRVLLASVAMWSSKRNLVTPAALNCGTASIIFFSMQQPSSNTEEVESMSEANQLTYIQQFDIQNMTWLPRQIVLGGMTGSAFSQNKQYTYAAGGNLGSLVVMYDCQKQCVEYTSSCMFANTSNAGMCVAFDRVYCSGGSVDTAYNLSHCPLSRFATSSENINNLTEFSRSRSSPVILLTTKKVFLIGGSDPENSLVIEIGCNADYLRHTLKWQSMEFPQIPKKFLCHFYVAKDTLEGISVGDKYVIMLHFNETTNRMVTTVLPFEPPDGKTVTGVYQFPEGNGSMYFVSTIQEGPSIPNYLWEKEKNTWITLPLPKGNCSMPSKGVILNKTYVVIT